MAFKNETTENLIIKTQALMNDYFTLAIKELDGEDVQGLSKLRSELNELQKELQSRVLRGRK